MIQGRGPSDTVTLNRAERRWADALAALSVFAAHPFELDGGRVLFDRRTGFSIPVTPALHAALRDRSAGRDPAAIARGCGAARAGALLRELQAWQRIGALTDEPPERLDEARPTGILSALLNVTHRCNLACEYCLMGHPALREGYGDRAENMTGETARQAVDFLARHGVREGLNLCFSAANRCWSFR